MKVGLLTDAPKHNLALMKLSAWHKAQGDEIVFNMPLWETDVSYASVLFERNKNLFNADTYGGPAYVNAVEFERGTYCSKLSSKIEQMAPDYLLYNLDYSLGYSFRPCFNSCHFCKVSVMDHPDSQHHSIWEFHNPKFKKICLLNNNTFQDPEWFKTFEEIWDADLEVMDENGYDLRLMDDAKADALHRTKFATPLHFAWDRMVDEPLIRHGLKMLEKHRLRSTSNGVYVLIGYDTTEEEDIHRCQIIDDYGLTPYPMPFIKTDYTKAFKRFINLHYYRKYKTIKEAWRDYKE